MDLQQIMQFWDHGYECGLIGPPFEELLPEVRITLRRSEIHGFVAGYPLTNGQSRIWHEGYRWGTLRRDIAVALRELANDTGS